MCTLLRAWPSGVGHAGGAGYFAVGMASTFDVDAWLGAVPVYNAVGKPAGSILPLFAGGDNRDDKKRCPGTVDSGC